MYVDDPLNRPRNKAELYERLAQYPFTTETAANVNTPSSHQNVSISTNKRAAAAVDLQQSALLAVGFLRLTPTLLKDVPHQMVIDAAKGLFTELTLERIALEEAEAEGGEEAAVRFSFSGQMPEIREEHRRRISAALSSTPHNSRGHHNGGGGSISSRSQSVGAATSSAAFDDDSAAMSPSPVRGAEEFLQITATNNSRGVDVVGIAPLAKALTITASNAVADHASMYPKAANDGHPMEEDAMEGTLPFRVDSVHGGGENNKDNESSSRPFSVSSSGSVPFRGGNPKEDGANDDDHEESASSFNGSRPLIAEDLANRTIAPRRVTIVSPTSDPTSSSSTPSETVGDNATIDNTLPTANTEEQEKHRPRPPPLSSSSTSNGDISTPPPQPAIYHRRAMRQQGITKTTTTVFTNMPLTLPRLPIKIMGAPAESFIGSYELKNSQHKNIKCPPAQTTVDGEEESEEVELTREELEVLQLLREEEEALRAEQRRRQREEEAQRRREEGLLDDDDNNPNRRRHRSPPKKHYYVTRLPLVSSKALIEDARHRKALQFVLNFERQTRKTRNREGRLVAQREAEEAKEAALVAAVKAEKEKFLMQALFCVPFGFQKVFRPVVDRMFSQRQLSRLCGPLFLVYMRRKRRQMILKRIMHNASIVPHARHALPCWGNSQFYDYVQNAGDVVVVSRSQEEEDGDDGRDGIFAHTSTVLGSTASSSVEEALRRRSGQQKAACAELPLFARDAKIFIQTAPVKMTQPNAGNAGISSSVIPPPSHPYVCRPSSNAVAHMTREQQQQQQQQSLLSANSNTTSTNANANRFAVPTQIVPLQCPSHALFAKWPPHALAKLLASMTPHYYFAGETMFFEDSVRNEGSSDDDSNDEATYHRVPLPTGATADGQSDGLADQRQRGSGSHSSIGLIHGSGGSRSNSRVTSATAQRFLVPSLAQPPSAGGGVGGIARSPSSNGGAPQRRTSVGSSSNAAGAGGAARNKGRRSRGRSRSITATYSDDDELVFGAAPRPEDVPQVTSAEKGLMRSQRRRNVGLSGRSDQTTATIRIKTRPIVPPSALEVKLMNSAAAVVTSANGGDAAAASSVSAAGTLAVSAILPASYGGLTGTVSSSSDDDDAVTVATTAVRSSSTRKKGHNAPPSTKGPSSSASSGGDQQQRSSGRRGGDAHHAHSKSQSHSQQQQAPPQPRIVSQRNYTSWSINSGNLDYVVLVVAGDVVEFDAALLRAHINRKRVEEQRAARERSLSSTTTTMHGSRRQYERNSASEGDVLGFGSLSTASRSTSVSSPHASSSSASVPLQLPLVPLPPVPIAYFPKGSVIGALQALTGHCFSRSVRCETDVVAYRIPVKKFLRFVTVQPVVAPPSTNIRPSFATAFAEQQQQQQLLNKDPRAAAPSSAPPPPPPQPMPYISKADRHAHQLALNSLQSYKADTIAAAKAICRDLFTAKDAHREKRDIGKFLLQKQFMLYGIGGGSIGGGGPNGGGSPSSPASATLYSHLLGGSGSSTALGHGNPFISVASGFSSAPTPLAPALLLAAYANKPLAYAEANRHAVQSMVSTMGIVVKTFKQCHPIFEQLPEGVINSLGEDITRAVAKPGDVICPEVHDSSRIYVIRRGRALLTVTRENPPSITSAYTAATIAAAAMTSLSPAAAKLDEDDVYNRLNRTRTASSSAGVALPGGGEEENTTARRRDNSVTFKHHHHEDGIQRNGGDEKKRRKTVVVDDGSRQRSEHEQPASGQPPPARTPQPPPPRLSRVSLAQEAEVIGGSASSSDDDTYGNNADDGNNTKAVASVDAAIGTAAATTLTSLKKSAPPNRNTASITLKLSESLLPIGRPIGLDTLFAWDTDKLRPQPHLTPQAAVLLGQAKVQNNLLTAAVVATPQYASQTISSSTNISAAVVSGKHASNTWEKLRKIEDANHTPSGGAPQIAANATTPTTTTSAAMQQLLDNAAGDNAMPYQIANRCALTRTAIVAESYVEYYSLPKASLLKVLRANGQLDKVRRAVSAHAKMHAPNCVKLFQGTGVATAANPTSGATSMPTTTATASTSSAPTVTNAAGVGNSTHSLAPQTATHLVGTKALLEGSGVAEMKAREPIFSFMGNRALLSLASSFKIRVTLPGERIMSPASLVTVGGDRNDDGGDVGADDGNADDEAGGDGQQRRGRKPRGLGTQFSDPSKDALHGRGQHGGGIGGIGYKPLKHTYIVGATTKMAVILLHGTLEQTFKVTSPQLLGRAAAAAAGSNSNGSGVHVSSDGGSADNGLSLRRAVAAGGGAAGQQQPTVEELLAILMPKRGSTDGEKDANQHGGLATSTHRTSSGSFAQQQNPSAIVAAALAGNAAASTALSNATPASVCAKNRRCLLRFPWSFFGFSETLAEQPVNYDLISMGSCVIATISRDVLLEAILMSSTLSNPRLISKAMKIRAMGRGGGGGGAASGSVDQNVDNFDVVSPSDDSSTNTTFGKNGSAQGGGGSAATSTAHQEGTAAQQQLAAARSAAIMSALAEADDPLVFQVLERAELITQAQSIAYGKLWLPNTIPASGSSASGASAISPAGSPASTPSTSPLSSPTRRRASSKLKALGAMNKANLQQILNKANNGGGHNSSSSPLLPRRDGPIITPHSLAVEVNAAAVTLGMASTAAQIEYVAAMGQQNIAASVGSSGGISVQMPGSGLGGAGINPTIFPPIVSPRGNPRGNGTASSSYAAGKKSVNGTTTATTKSSRAGNNGDTVLLTLAEQRQLDDNRQRAAGRAKERYAEERKALDAAQEQTERQRDVLKLSRLEGKGGQRAVTTIPSGSGAGKSSSKRRTSKESSPPPPRVRDEYEHLLRPQPPDPTASARRLQVAFMDFEKDKFDVHKMRIANDEDDVGAALVHSATSRIATTKAQLRQKFGEQNLAPMARLLKDDEEEEDRGNGRASAPSVAVPKPPPPPRLLTISDVFSPEQLQPDLYSHHRPSVANGGNAIVDDGGGLASAEGPISAADPHMEMLRAIVANGTASNNGPSASAAGALSSRRGTAATATAMDYPVYGRRGTGGSVTAAFSDSAASLPNPSAITVTRQHHYNNRLSSSSSAAVGQLYDRSPRPSNEAEARRRREGIAKDLDRMLLLGGQGRMVQSAREHYAAVTHIHSHSVARQQSVTSVRTSSVSNGYRFTAGGGGDCDGANDAEWLARMRDQQRRLKGLPAK